MSWEELQNGWKELRHNGSSLAWELLLTLSSRKSLLSSKRLERFALFSVSLSMGVIYFYLHIHTITVSEMLMIVGAFMVWAGFNLHKTEAGKKPNGTDDEK